MCGGWTQHGFNFDPESQRRREGEIEQAFDTDRQDHEAWSKTEKNSCRGLFFLSARRMDPPGDADADEIEEQHRNRIDAHGSGVRAGTDDGGNQKYGEDCVANVFPKKFRADNAEQ